MVIGEADLGTDGAGPEAEVGTSCVGDGVVDLLGAGVMEGTLMDDIITTGGLGVVAGVVLTTTVALDLDGSNESQRERRYISKM